MFTVIGLGKTGHAVSAYLMSKGYPVVAWDRDAEKCAFLAREGVRSEGALEGRYYPQVTADFEQAARAGKYLLVMTTAQGHRDIALRLRGILQHGQRVIVFNCNWGAYEFYRELKQEAEEKQVVIAETGGMLFLTNLPENGRCFVRSIKGSMSVASIPAGACQGLIKELAEPFPQFYGVENVLVTSLNASNPILHAPLDLFSLARIEKEEDYRLYEDAATPAAVGYIENIDQERMAVLGAMRIKGQSCLAIINRAWNAEYGDLRAGLLDVPAYKSSMGPKSLKSRHFTEDLPYGIAPMKFLGKRFGVPTPYIDALLAIYSLTLRWDILKAAPDLSGLNLEELL